MIMGEGIPEMWAALTTTLAGPVFQKWPHPKALPYTKKPDLFCPLYFLFKNLSSFLC
jgi:hypothetical protein